MDLSVIGGDCFFTQIVSHHHTLHVQRFQVFQKFGIEVLQSP